MNKLYESWEENTDIGFVVMKVKVLFLEAWVFFFFFCLGFIGFESCGFGVLF